eukprot:TRINITY_DN25094_c1_g1_i1.p1 TRINITY_DN25094_c1_g1~~TRINITY_DN25094_c1_g1_i1.p1  ORF type:complete len:120 (-),score=7.47 TRINITY_DN25094_c1_g1_i1:361-678(-)
MDAHEDFPIYISLYILLYREIFMCIHPSPQGEGHIHSWKYLCAKEEKPFMVIYRRGMFMCKEGKPYKCPSPYGEGWVRMNIRPKYSGGWFFKHRRAHAWPIKHHL